MPLRGRGLITLRRAFSARLRQPEVEHFDDAVRRDLDVGGLEIAVDDAPFVRGFERARDIARDGQRLGQAKTRLSVAVSR